MSYKDLEVRKQYMKKYNAEHIEEKREYNRLHRKRWAELQKKWLENNPMKKHLFTKQRKAIGKYPGKLSIHTLQTLYEDNIKKYGKLTCYLCLQPIAFGNDSLDHNIPASRGGTNDYENLGIAHIQCNNKKRLKTTKELQSQ